MTIYYVSNQTGADKNSGTTPNTPFKTIQKAAQILKPGDICKIFGGIYRETIYPANSGTAQKPIIYDRYNQEEVIITGTDI